MKLRDITGAITDGNLPAVRQAFSLLVGPEASQIEAQSPGFRVVALNRVCGALAADAEVMPEATAAALELPTGSTYVAGAAKARRDSARLARRLMALS
jgi:hypothetical protein